ncbi:MAG: hypothetical protein JXJ22_18540 [Bacteroidales bacterium]|nr:hypothetical protein [Bacteroidales bacterium]
MTTENNNTFKLSSVELIQFAWKKRKQLLIITIIAAVLSIIASFQITELFKSSVVLFPASNISVSQALMSNQLFGGQGLLTFGEEEQAEQLLQILYSDQIKNRIIEKYDLLNHYDIKPDHKYKYTLLDKKYKKQITFKRTKYMSIIVSVMDKDPETASNIANDIAGLIDTTMNNIQRERAIKAFETVENEYVSLSDQINKLEDSLDVLRSYGITDYESQAQVLNSAYVTALASNNERAINSLKKQLDVLSKYGGAYVSITKFLEYEKEHLSQLKAKYAEAKVEAELSLPHKFVVDYASPAERKSYPKKSVIVAGSTIAAFLFAYLVLLIMDIIRKSSKK